MTNTSHDKRGDGFLPERVNDLCADAGPYPRSPERWQTMDRIGLIEAARKWADQNMAIHDQRTDLARSQRDAAFYRADALYEFAAHIEDGNFDAARPSPPTEANSTEGGEG